MIPKKYITWGSSGAVIRELAAYGAERAKVVGPENVYDFTIGSPSIEPPKEFLDAVERLMKTVSPIELHTYAPAAGLESVRSAVAKYLTESFGVEYSPNDIYMTHGASSALAIILAALMSEGEEALVLAPYFPEYKIYVEQAGGTLIEVSCDEDFQVDLAALEAKLTPKTSVIIINSPNNPSGAVLSEESIIRLSEILSEAERRFGKRIFLISDEPYREIVYDGIKVPFVTKYYRDTVVCYSYSKSLSLPGERVGYILVSPEIDGWKDVYAAVCGAGRALGYICTPSVFQHMLTSCAGLTADLSVYAKNRELLYGALTEMGFSAVRPDGAFYLFVKSPEANAAAFSERAKKYELLLVPSDDFGLSGYVRISYCVSENQIRRSLPAFRKLAEEYFK